MKIEISLSIFANKDDDIQTDSRQHSDMVEFFCRTFVHM